MGLGSIISGAASIIGGLSGRSAGKESFYLQEIARQFGGTHAGP